MFRLFFCLEDGNSGLEVGAVVSRLKGTTIERTEEKHHREQ